MQISRVLFDMLKDEFDLEVVDDYVNQHSAPEPCFGLVNQLSTADSIDVLLDCLDELEDDPDRSCEAGALKNMLLKSKEDVPGRDSRGLNLITYFPEITVEKIKTEE